MTAFRNKEGPASEVALQEFFDSNPGFDPTHVVHLSDVDRELIVRWVTRNYQTVRGGVPIVELRR